MTTLAFSIIFFQSLLISHVFCWDQHTDNLDISAVLGKTLDVFSSEPRTTTTSPRQLDHTAPLLGAKVSLELHPRAAIQRPSHRDYRALQLSRLNRDAARVANIAARASGDGHLGRSLPDVNLTSKNLVAPAVSGDAFGSGEYFVRIGYGTPPRPLYLVPDSGSDLNWIQCKPCEYCFPQVDPIFDPRNSSTFKGLPCDDPRCRWQEPSGCFQGSCSFHLAYGDGSIIMGQLGTEKLSFGQSGSDAGITGAVIGCSRISAGVFAGFSGLLGLGGGALSLVSQINAKSFSYCFVDRDFSTASTLELNPEFPAGEGVTVAGVVPNHSHRTYYYLDMTGISVGGQAIPVQEAEFQMDARGEGGIILDSGTTVSRLPTRIYNALRDEFKAQTQNLPAVAPLSMFDTCYDLSKLTNVTIPKLVFVFRGGATLALSPKNVMVPMDSNGTFCFAFGSTAMGMGIIGNVQQMGMRITYGLDRKLIAFQTNQC